MLYQNPASTAFRAYQKILNKEEFTDEIVYLRKSQAERKEKMLIVRQANESDLEDIYKIEKATFGNSLEVWSKDGILFSITDESYKVFVCELDKIVGYIIMTYSPYEAYISKIVIDSTLGE